VLTVTENASQAIQALADSVETPEAGLRIFAQQAGDGESQATLELALTEGPAMGDEVVELEETKLFLETNAATYLEDKVLDADVEGENVRFSISLQGGPEGTPGA
jgi:iron-sulfur cluster assembly protein